MPYSKESIRKTKEGSMKKILLSITMGILPFAYADCPDALYHCFANKEPQLFTYKEVELQNKLLNNHLDQVEHANFPFVSVGTYFEPTSLRCIKKSDALERATRYCKAKFPSKQISVREFVKEKSVDHYACTEHDKTTNIKVVASDQGAARIKCQFIAASLGIDRSGWNAQKVEAGILKKIKKKLDLDEFPMDFLNEWQLGGGGISEVRDVLPAWLYEILTKKSSPTSQDIEQHKKTILSAIQKYREALTQEPTMITLGETLNKPGLLSSTQPNPQEVASVCKRLKLLYHPDKHQHNKQWWLGEFQTIENACSAIIA